MRAFFLVILTTFIFIGCKQNKNSEPVKHETHKIVPVISTKKMVRIKGGIYASFIGKDSGRINTVKDFLMDEAPVTNAEFLEFVKKNPQWSKSKVLRIYADSTYLKAWPSDFELPKDKSPEAPITDISWFAATAYAKSVGKRLPTLSEWEYVGLADEVSPDASKKPEFTQYILNSYQDEGKNKLPVKLKNSNFYGIYDMYKVWEWLQDFNSVMVSGESRNDKSGDNNLFCAGAAVTSSDLRNYAAFMRYALRGSLKAQYCLNNLGFRCANDIK